MTRTTRSALLVLSALLFAACGDRGPAPGSTDSTTRALLNQTPVAGPSTLFDPDTSLSTDTPITNLLQLGYNFGSVDAPVKLIEFSDYGCGYCRGFHTETFATVRKEFIDTGEYEWKFMPFITGMFKNSLAATEAAECTLEQSPEKFETLSDRLWSDQPEWKGSNRPESVVRGWVSQLAIDMDRFDTCMGEDRRMPRIAGNTSIARQLGVRGTPTFFIVGYGPVQGALPLASFRGILGAVYEDVVSQGGDSTGAEPPDSAGSPG
jgi:protein-disulfide isomerase